MKIFPASIILAASVLTLAAQTNQSPAPPAEEAQAAVQDFLQQGNRAVTPPTVAAPPTRQLPGLPGQRPATPPPTFPAPNRVQNTGQPAPANGASATNPAIPSSLPGVTATPGTGDDNELIATDLLRLGEGATLDNLLDIYSMLVGRVILKPAALPMPGEISLNITDVELTKKEAIQALDTYLALNNISTVPMGEKFLLVVPSAEANRQGGEFSSLITKELPEAAQFTSHIVQLKHVKPTEILDVLLVFTKSPESLVAIDSSQTLVIRDYAINVKRMLELIEKIDVAIPVEYKTELIPIKYALAADIAQVLGGLAAGGGGSVTTVGSASQSGFRGAGNQASGFPNQSGFGGQNNNNRNSGSRGSYNTFSTMQARTPTPVGATAANRSAFQNRLNQIVGSVGGGTGGEVQVLSETKIIADERTNSLLVFANEQDMETIKDIISRMDVVLAQVLIEAILMEVNIGDRQNVSVSAVSKNQNGDNKFGSVMNNGLGFANFGGATNVSSFGGAAPSGFSWFGEFGDKFAVAVNMAAQDSRIKVLSRPSVQTSHAVPASLFVGETRPYVTGTYNGGFNSGVSSQYQQTQIGLSLSVLPLINPEGLVVMDIQQQVQQVGGSVTIDGNDVPITQDQSASAKVAVRDRDTIILGGFIRNSLEKSESGVPFLKDIPLLGNLFKSKNHNDSRRELVILIRPTVLPTPEDAANLVNQRRDTTPELKEAEVDFEVEEQQLLKKANEKIMKKRLGIEGD